MTLKSHFEKGKVKVKVSLKEIQEDKMEWFKELIIGLLVVIYLVYTVGSMYMALLGKIEKRTDKTAKIVYYHGIFWIIILTLSCAGGLMIIFAKYFYKIIGV